MPKTKLLIRGKDIKPDGVIEFVVKEGETIETEDGQVLGRVVDGKIVKAG